MGRGGEDEEGVKPLLEASPHQIGHHFVQQCPSLELPRHGEHLQHASRPGSGCDDAPGVKDADQIIVGGLEAKAARLDEGARLPQVVRCKE